jgi:hypothetical protein
LPETPQPFVIVSIVSQAPSWSVSRSRESSVRCTTKISPSTTFRPSPS